MSLYTELEKNPMTLDEIAKFENISKSSANAKMNRMLRGYDNLRSRKIKLTPKNKRRRTAILYYVEG